jgi:hypothetical protein
LEISPLLILFVLAVVAFALLLRGRITPTSNKATEIAVAGLTSINITGAIGLVWFIAEMLFYDGVMVPEILSCLVLMAILAGFTAGALALKRRGKTKTAFVLLAITALPMLFVYGFLVYLELNPIDWR